MTEAAGRLLFRSLTNEQNSTILPDSTGGIGAQVVDTYLQAGLFEVSRLLGGYYYKDDDATLALTANTSEYALPTDFVDVLWVRVRELYLKRSTQEEWLAAKVNWTNTAAGTPTEYSVYGTKVIFYPKPSQTFLDAGSDDVPEVRYIATPPDYTGNGFAGLRAQDHFLPVYYAAALFIQLHNDVPEMQTRAANLLKLFYAGCEAAKPFYDSKRMPGRKAP